jgi:hypothetical protein
VAVVQESVEDRDDGSAPIQTFLMVDNTAFRT